jgi:hypothetical protein
MICIRNGYELLFPKIEEEFAMRKSAALYQPRQLRELKTAELLVITSLRLWVLSHFSGACDWPDWREGFIRGGMSSADAVAFHALCRIIAISALRRLDVRPLHCARLGEDEAWLLEWLALLQRDRVRDAESIVRRICPPSAVRLAIGSGRVFTRALASLRLWLTAHHPEPLAPSPDWIMMPHDSPRIH